MKSQAQVQQPLGMLRVLDISTGIAGPFCSKLLGDLGANVVKVEAPEGDETRLQGPFPDGVSDIESSAPFFFLNTSKRSVVLDLNTESGRAQLGRLVAHFDIVIASETIESLERKGLGYECFKRWNSACILTTISGFGSFGPYSDFESSHLIACAVGGWANFCGTPDREPLQSGGAITQTLTGAFAAVATLMAAFGRAKHGHGEHIDVSAQEAVLTGAQLPTLLYEYRGLLPTRYSSIGSGAGAAFMLPTQDGYIGLNALTLAQWQMLCEFLGRGDIATDPRYQGLSWTNPNDEIEEVRTAFSQALKGRSAAQLFHEAEAARVPFGLVPDLKSIFSLEPHVERGFFVTLDHPVAGAVDVPGVPFKSTATSPAPYRPPMLGEHNQEVMAELDELSEEQLQKSGVVSGSHTPPLKGIRILDLSMFFAGPVAAQIAADAGAEVIKVESIQRIDGWRGAGTAGQPGDVPSWEASPYFNWVNRGKRAITLNLKDPRGRDAIRKMVRSADVLIENYTPRVMKNFGLSYEVLHEINPKLVMLSLSGFGHDTSWRDYVAFGMSTEQMSGIAHLTGYENDEPLFTGMTGGDLFSGVMGAIALIAALHHAKATGVGQHINLSQLEACNLYIGDVMTGWSLTGEDPGRTGNNHRNYAPQGIYPCAEEKWLGITCKTQDHWRALCAAMGNPSNLNTDQDLSERLKHRSEIDAVIKGWTKTQNHIELMKQLQNQGVPAGAVLCGPELLDDPQLKARASFLAQDRPGVGVKHYPYQPYRFQFAESVPDERAPLLGEHVEEVLTEIAGLTSEELAELVIDDVVGTVPVAAR